MIRDEELQKEYRKLQLTWSAMLISLAVYLFVGLQFVEEVQIAIDAETLTVLRSTLYVIAFITLFITGYVKKLLLSKKRSSIQATQNDRSIARHALIQKYATAMMVALAMTETIGVYGFVLFLLGKDVLDLYLFILVSAATMFAYRPNRDEIIGLGDQ
jgi:hypothetical protein